MNHEPPAMENMPFPRGVACICQLLGFQSILVSELDGFMIRPLLTRPVVEMPQNKV